MPDNAMVTYYRLDARRLIVSDQSSAHERDIAVLAPVLSPGTHKLPNRSNWTVRTTIADSMLTAVIDDGGGPLARIWVVLDGRDLARVVRPPRILDLPVPACVVTMLRAGSRCGTGRLWGLVETMALSWIEHVEWTPAPAARPSQQLC